MWGQTDSRSIFKPPKLQKIVWRLTFHHLQICFLLTRLSLSILLLLQSLTVMHCNLTRLNCLGLSDRFSFVWREQERNANQFYVDQFSEIDFYWTVFVVYTLFTITKSLYWIERYFHLFICTSEIHFLHSDYLRARKK